MMPEARAPVSTPVLLVRIVDVLDRTREGQQGARALEQRFADARAAVGKLPPGPERASAEARAAAEIEEERARLRDGLLGRARAGAEALRKKRGALVVLDASLAVALDAAVDVTDELIAALDAS